MLLERQGTRSATIPLSHSGEKAWALGNDPAVFADIYRAQVNIAIWRRSLGCALQQCALSLAATHPGLQVRVIGSCERIFAEVEARLPDVANREMLLADIQLLLSMFGELFDLPQMGLRLAVLSKAMCPRFHVDRVPCRLLTTYTGAGTQWVANTFVERGPTGRVEVASGAAIEQVAPGRVALLKGDAWEGNEFNGLVHRSPDASVAMPRLVLSLDFA